MANKTSAVDSYNDRIDAAKREYESATTQEAKDAAHAKAEAVRAEASNAGYVAGNYIQSSSKSSKNNSVNNSNYSYDAATNYERVYEPVEEEVPKVDERQALINEYVKAQKTIQEEQLKKAYENVIYNIGKSEQEVKDNATSNRNMASVNNQLARNDIARFMANNGLTNSGTNAQANINAIGNLQNNISTITGNEQKALNDYINQRNLAYQNYQNDLALANAGIDAQALGQQLEYLNAMSQLQAQQDYQTQMALMQRQWNLEDNANNSIAWTDPYSGMTYQIDPNTAAQLGYNLYNANLNRALKYSSGGTAVTNTPQYKITDGAYKTLQTEYNNAVKDGFSGTYDDYLYLNYPGYVSSDYVPTLKGYNIIDMAHTPEQKNASKQLLDGVYRGTITVDDLADPVYAEAIKRTVGRDTIYQEAYGIAYNKELNK